MTNKTIKYVSVFLLALKWVLDIERAFDLASSLTFIKKIYTMLICLLLNASEILSIVTLLQLGKDIPPVSTQRLFFASLSILVTICTLLFSLFTLSSHYIIKNRLEKRQLIISWYFLLLFLFHVFAALAITSPSFLSSQGFTFIKCSYSNFS
jgi:hypothetical protein